MPRSHFLPALKPDTSWHIYIDETGHRFSEEEDGAEGRVVAVCMPGSDLLPELFMHCMEADRKDVEREFEKLLNSSCGILGLSQQSLHVRGEHGWMQSICELAKWVWRLLPLPKGPSPSALYFYVEERAPYLSSNPSQYSYGMQDLLRAELIREDAGRARYFELQKFSFVSKRHPRLAWADVASFCWGKSAPSRLKDMLEESGLLTSCLLTIPSGILDICEEILTGERPEGQEWLALVKDHARPVPEQRQQLTAHVLSRLQEACRKKPSRWQPYIRAMHEYLLSKRYDIGVLEYMAEWFSPMTCTDEKTRFFWLTSRLAQLNHEGDACSRTVQEVKAELERLAPVMNALNSDTRIHLSLRLAISDANAFDFEAAERRLARWNPDAGGTLPETTLYAGKVLGSLGLYSAFRGDLAAACDFFRRAIALFGELPAQEACLQLPQARSYLAIAAMDREDVPTEQVRALVEQALGADIEGFASLMTTTACLTDRYGHYLLTRYLARRGTERERAPYLASRTHWTRQGQGLGSGHPWPMIQYHRWLMTDRADEDLRRELAHSLFVAMGSTAKPTMELITWAIAFSMGLDPLEPAARDRLAYFTSVMPCCTEIVYRLMAGEKGDELLAQKVMPFLYS